MVLGVGCSAQKGGQFDGIEADHDEPLPPGLGAGVEVDLSGSRCPLQQADDRRGWPVRARAPWPPSPAVLRRGCRRLRCGEPAAPPRRRRSNRPDAARSRGLRSRGSIVSGTPGLRPGDPASWTQYVRRTTKSVVCFLLSVVCCLRAYGLQTTDFALWMGFDGHAYMCVVPDGGPWTASLICTSIRNSRCSTVPVASTTWLPLPRRMDSLPWPSPTTAPYTVLWTSIGLHTPSG